MRLFTKEDTEDKRSQCPLKLILVTNLSYKIYDSSVDMTKLFNFRHMSKLQQIPCWSEKHEHHISHEQVYTIFLYAGAAINA